MRRELTADMVDEVCPSGLSPFRVGDKWAGLVLKLLEDGPRRFGELRVPLHRVSPKVLTASLRALERDGLVSRTEHTGQGRRVEYDLTPLGRSLLGPLAVVCAWAEEHWEELLDARESYDRAAARGGEASTAATPAATAAASAPAASRVAASGASGA
ncbi:winged helix-turn-helix transcriptional regulator [Streptomonospora nanhaiensis]|uniref:winged helix-turn-helix transcriptional regulator n=1 Tax=Streptomonospora nanhaiensis TaxID=1323731 RepID=UPI001C391D6E|nr:helix-turn-helix domain-containing protein [Streptomonospora nanhaiensis]MBV2362931.1 helix-turn-helix transcriptional regulator [Streptomonospora nanhaiensis]MBX9391538.1 helix-turn-helix transcriptional regulator [Streptomonospora nanhaiensis]